MTIDFLRNFMIENGVDALLVNSTNKFLVEYNSLEENSRYKLTGFSGSTGDVLLEPEKCYLFVDGRYHIQADMEVNHNIVEVVKLQTGQTFVGEFAKKIKENSTLGIFSAKNSMARIELLKKSLENKNVSIKFFDIDPLDVNCAEKSRTVSQIPAELAGLTISEKLSKIRNALAENQGLLITDLEEVSYLCNLRSFSEQFSAKILGKLVLTLDDAVLFTDEDVSILDEVQVKSYSEFREYVLALPVALKILVDNASVNAQDYFLLGNRACEIKNSPVKLMKAVKNSAEISHYKKAFEATDKTMHAIRDYIENSENISELDIVEKLEEFFYMFGAKSLSFKSIVAKDKNSALAHYSKSSKDEIIKDGSLVLIDCGAYYEGGLATDITRVFVKGEPSELQKCVYTTVLKTFLNAFNYCANEIVGYDVDNLARQIVAENQIDGFEFNHGLGHGIGVSVHEMPPNLSKNEIAKTQIKDNMCFTIEPGLYNQKHFGVRLENSCYLENGVIKSFTNMCYEKKLIDFSLLTEQEKEWLGKFEVR